MVVMFVFCLLSLLGLSMGLSDVNNENWPNGPTFWQKDRLNFELTSVENLTLQMILEKSNKFPLDFPINNVKISELKNKVDEKILEMNVNSAYPILHEYAFNLYSSFLEHMKRLGPEPAKSIYADMDLIQFVDRILLKRAASFGNTSDDYLLMSKESGTGGWESIGTDKELSPLLLKDCLSYDEMKLSALLSISSKTSIVNNGDDVEDSAIIISTTPPRLDKEFVMEYREIVKTSNQNTHVYGFGQSFVPTIQGYFSSFYGEPNLTYDEYIWGQQFDNTDRFEDLGNKKYFDRFMYNRRVTISIDTLLIEANARAISERKMVHLHIIPMNPSDFNIGKQQLFLKMVIKRIKFLGDNLRHISDVSFDGIEENIDEYSDGEKVPISNHLLGGITLHLKKREIFAKLTGSDTGKLLVVSYLKNPNSLPGNEFWRNNLDISNESMVAKSTQIAEIQNPHINPKISAKNLKIVTISNGLVTLEEFKKLHNND